MHVYEVQIREVGDRQPLTTYNVLAEDLEDAQKIVKDAAKRQYQTISVEICASKEIARDVIFNAKRNENLTQGYNAVPSSEHIATSMRQACVKKVKAARKAWGGAAMPGHEVDQLLAELSSLTLDQVKEKQ